ncbi:CAP domain-containing protein [Streptacidiphilus albus]|uniref:CAP domain-containing protein n=1 Tax=Streptacidiphilus albus TaxID=105425 RepID=UPI0006916D57|nr:CAP domain-containing protein [Streptacidiphilus albus]
MPRHARTRTPVALARAARRSRRIPGIAVAVCGTALVAAAGAVFGGLLPQPPGAPAGVALAGDQAGPATAPFSTAPFAAAPSAVVPSAVVIRSARPAPAPTVIGTGTAATRIGAETAGSRASVLSLVNAQRTRHGCGTLTGSSALTELAQSYSTEMGTENFFSHTDPAGRTPWDRARALGIGNLGGENIAMGQQTPQEVVAAWMHSAGHRANILDCEYRSLGVGVYYGSNGGPWWTEDFGF